jgi:hypothetical protein
MVRGGDDWGGLPSEWYLPAIEGFQVAAPSRSMMLSGFDLGALLPVALARMDTH